MEEAILRMNKIIGFVSVLLVFAAVLSAAGCTFGIGTDSSATEVPTESLTAEQTTDELTDPEVPTVPEATTAEVTTEEETTVEETTEEETTVEETTEEETTEEETTVEETTEEDTSAYFVTGPVEGAEIIGFSEKGYAIQEKEGFFYVGGILIANKTYPLPADYVPEGYPNPMTDQVINRMLPEAQAAFEEMAAAFKAEKPSNKGFKIQSGYRSYMTQNRLYNNYLKSGGLAYADGLSARAGHSEHQLGLAADLNVVGTYTLNESFKNTVEGKWLAENSWKYGFILRYPEGTTPKTGYIFEPWHFRYVGLDVAKAVYESGLCLEEYLGITSVYSN